MKTKEYLEEYIISEKVYERQKKKLLDVRRRYQKIVDVLEQEVSSANAWVPISMNHFLAPYEKKLGTIASKDRNFILTELKRREGIISRPVGIERPEAHREYVPNCVMTEFKKVSADEKSAMGITADIHRRLIGEEFIFAKAHFSEDLRPHLLTYNALLAMFFSKKIHLGWQPVNLADMCNLYYLPFDEVFKVLDILRKERVLYVANVSGKVITAKTKQCLFFLTTTEESRILAETSIAENSYEVSTRKDNKTIFRRYQDVIETLASGEDGEVALDDFSEVKRSINAILRHYEEHVTRQSDENLKAVHKLTAECVKVKEENEELSHKIEDVEKDFSTFKVTTSEKADLIQAKINEYLFSIQDLIHEIKTELKNKTFTPEEHEEYFQSKLNQSLQYYVTCTNEVKTLLHSLSTYSEGTEEES